MPAKASASFLELPIEFVYRILDYVDDFTILCSVRDVCTRLNNITDTYNRYKVIIRIVKCLRTIY